MEGIYKHYIIDMSCNNNFVQIPTVQGDGNNVRGFEVELISNNVQYVVDKENTIVAIAGTKPDTKKVLNECQVTEEGYILVDITSQMSAVPGRGDYSIMLMDRKTNSQLKSFPFYILTTESFNAAELISTNEFQLLVQKINEVENVEARASGFEEEVIEREKIRQTSEQERINNDLRREENENTRSQNEESRISSESLRVQAESDRVATEEQRVQAEILRNTQEDERKQSEQTRESNESKRLESETNRNDAELIRVQNENQRILDEQQRVSNENTRVQNESIRQSNETQRQTTFDATVEAMNNTKEYTNQQGDRARQISDDLEHKIATDYYRGAPGKDGVVTTVEMNQLAFNVVDGNLILTYEEGNTDAQKFSINENGELVYTLH
jgi:hypothetical protein